MSLDFEPVAIEQARKTLDEVPTPSSYAGTTSMAAQAQPTWKRRPESENDKRLSARSFKWLYDMPREERPIQLALQFPRIVNKFSEIWRDERATTAYLVELLVDHRGNRKGFPAPVMQDLLRLRAWQARQEGAAH